MKQLILFLFVLSLTSVNAQNLNDVAFDTNGPMGECLFPQDENGKTKFSGVIECPYRSDTIMGLAKEFIYDITKKYDAKTKNHLEGITKVACDMELKVGKNYLSLNIGGLDIGTWERAASTIRFNLMIEIRDKKYRYTLSDFYTERRRIHGDAKEQGPPNMIHWQRVNSLNKEIASAKKKEREEKEKQVSFEKAQYQAEYAAVQDVIAGLKSMAVIENDF